MEPLFLLALAIGLWLDHLLGEPRRWHPLVGFGQLAHWSESRLRRGAPGRALENRLRGVVAWVMLVLPLPLAAWVLLAALPWPLALAAHAALVWFALGGRSLREHACAVATPLAVGDLVLARQRVGYLVSRQTETMTADEVAVATVETTLENGNDAIFGALFWAAVLGGPGALAFRLANTLDAMWGYKDARRLHFGWCAARADDLLGWLPARLTALTYALLGDARGALGCWKSQAGGWSSPNAGPVMAAGAGALGVRIGGAAVYQGITEQRPALGLGAAPVPGDIERALLMLRRGSLWWGVLAFVIALFAATGGALA